MCLETYHKPKLRTANQDLHVFKIVVQHRNPDSLGQWFTPFQHVPIEKNGSYTANVPTYTENSYRYPPDTYRFLIKAGINSFATLEGARKAVFDYKKSMGLTSFTNPTIVPCLIPKGSQYYKGFFGMNNLCYASTAITYPSSFKGIPHIKKEKKDEKQDSHVLPLQKMHKRKTRWNISKRLRFIRSWMDS